MKRPTVAWQTFAPRALPAQRGARGPLALLLAGWVLSASRADLCRAGHLDLPGNLADAGREGRTSPSAADSHLDAPLPVPRASFFHAALEIPPLEGARPLGPGSLLVALETAHTRSVKRARSAGVESSFDGLFHDWGTVKVALGALQGLEVFGRASLAGWDEKLDKFFLLDAAGQPIVRNEAGVFFGGSASQRHDNVSDAVLGLKGQVLGREHAGFDLSGLISAKIPVSRPTDLTSAGTHEINLALLATIPLGDFTFHVNAGAGIPLGPQNLFLRSDNADVGPFVHGGAAVAWRALASTAIIAQVAANSSAFERIEFLEGPPVSVELGVRQKLGDFFAELAVGTGLLPASSYDFAIHFELGWLLAGWSPGST